MFEICFHNDVPEKVLIDEFNLKNIKITPEFIRDNPGYISSYKRFEHVPCFYGIKYKTSKQSNTLYFCMTFRPNIDKYIEELNKVFTNFKIESIAKKVSAKSVGDFPNYIGSPLENSDKDADVVDNRIIKVTINNEYNYYTKRVVIYMMCILIRLLYLGRFMDCSEKENELLNNGDVINFIIERNKRTREIDAEHTPCMKKTSKFELIELTKEMLLTLNDINAMNKICRGIFLGKTNSNSYLSDEIKQTKIFESIDMYLKGLI